MAEHTLTGMPAAERNYTVSAVSADSPVSAALSSLSPQPDRKQHAAITIAYFIVHLLWSLNFEAPVIPCLPADSLY